MPHLFSQQETLSLSFKTISKPILCPGRRLSFIFRLFALPASLKRESEIKSSWYLFSTQAGVQQISRESPLNNFHPLLYTILASEEFPSQCAASLAILSYLSVRGWGQIHWICLIEHSWGYFDTITATVNRNPSGRMKAICSVDCSLALQSSGQTSCNLLDHQGLPEKTRQLPAEVSALAFLLGHGVTIGRVIVQISPGPEEEV